MSIVKNIIMSSVASVVFVAGVSSANAAEHHFSAHKVSSHVKSHVHHAKAHAKAHANVASHASAKAQTPVKVNSALPMPANEKLTG